MPQFRKKPVVVNAVEWTGGEGCVLAIRRLSGDDKKVAFLGIPPHTAVIETLEGTMKAQFGDFIIRGVKGELYPCKPNIFEATYEPVDEGKDKI